MVKQRIFNHHKFDRAVTCPTKIAAKKRSKEMKHNTGKGFMQIRTVKTKIGYAIYYRIKSK